ncbi:tetratricopeptide repeat protein [Streptomyces sp. NPDC101194]|uniref:tetratricopeptide repeat protein n=1 Tax=Streptomyces sp. NPDC101194 TaxID=3366127 RepID=UPI0037F813E0
MPGWFPSITAQHGSSAVGYAKQVHHHFAAPRAPAEWPYQVGVIPGRANSFQPLAVARSTTMLSQALAGSGGAGKTQIAAAYARAQWESGSVDVLVWITATSRQAVIAGYAQAAVELLAADPGAPEQAARTFLAWLEPKHGQRPCRWMIVLDALADPADMHDLWPPEGNGRTLVTTARHEAFARWRGQAGDAAGAATAYAELLADRERLLGPDHPETLTTRHELAYWQGQAGDASGAATALTDVLADFIRLLGPDHPDTLTTQHNLAYWRGQAGDAAGAATAYAELLADRERLLGPHHLDTLTTRHNLAYWRGQAGDAAGAATAYAELLADRERLLGPHHLDTLTTRHNLAYWRGQAGGEEPAVG